MKSKVRVGLVGSQFISSIHAEALKRCSRAEIVAVASPTPGNAAAFAARHGIPRAFTSHRELLEMEGLDLVVVGAPNDLHCGITVDAAAAKPQRDGAIIANCWSPGLWASGTT